MKKRADKTEKERRVSQFVRLLANGAVTSDLVRLAADEWGLGRRMAEKYIAEAREIIVKDIDQDRRVVVAELMSVCRTVIKRGLKGENLSVVIGAVNTIARMGGLEAR